jgi:hypothetical protein
MQSEACCGLFVVTWRLDGIERLFWGVQIPPGSRLFM